MSSNVVDATVVVPTLGRPPLVRNLLRSLLDTSPQPAEIVLVDQSRDDRTANVVREVGGDRVRHLPMPERGVAAARNRGLVVAAHEVVLFTDDDCTVARDWVGRAVQLLTENSTRIVTGRVLAAGDESHTPSTINAEQRIDYAGGREFWVLYSGNMAARRELLAAVGGFDEHLPRAVDNDLCYRWLRAGGRISYEPDLVVWHHDWRAPHELEAVYRGYATGQGMFYAKHLLRGDLSFAPIVVSDLRKGLRVLPARLRGEPASANWRHALLLGIPRGLVEGWRLYGRDRGRASA